MTPMQWTAGCSVIVGATVCGLISSEIVNSNIPAGTHTRERAVAGQNQNENVGKGICFTLGGKQFESVIIRLSLSISGPSWRILRVRNTISRSTARTLPEQRELRSIGSCAKPPSD